MKILRKITLFALVFFMLAASFSGCGLVQAGFEAASGALGASKSAPPTPEPAPSISAKPEDGEKRIVPFDQMEYARPDALAVSSRINEIKTEAMAQSDISGVTPLLDEFETIYNNYSSMAALAGINSAADKADEYWMAEDEYCTNGYISVQEAGQALLRAMYESSFKEGIEQWQEGYFDGMPEEDTVTPITKPMFQREAELSQEYTNTITLGTIDFSGSKMTLSDIYALEDYNAYSAAIEQWLTEFNPKLAGIYVELVKLRTSIADILGYDDYMEMRYAEEMGGYDEDMVRSMLDEIKTYVVPAYKEATAYGAFYSPEVNMDYSEFMNITRDVLNDISPKFLPSFDAMQENELCGWQPAQYKEAGAATYYIPDYDASYILMSYTGNADSMSTFVHEFGHFNDNYTTDYANPYQMDIAEIFSQALELLYSDYYPSYFGGEDGYEMRFDTLSGSFSTIVSQPLYTAIELRAYSEGENLTVEKLNEIAREEYIAFGNDWEALGADYVNLDWVTNPQIATVPFHTLTYATSVSVALQIWEVAQTDKQKAVDTYMQLLNNGLKYDFVESVQNAGLISPFEEGAMKNMADMITRYMTDGGLSAAA